MSNKILSFSYFRASSKKIDGVFGQNPRVIYILPSALLKAKMNSLNLSQISLNEDCNSEIWSDCSDFDAESISESIFSEPEKHECKEAECSICYDGIGAINCLVTECGHKFHTSCLFKSFNTGMDGCPLCRQELVEAVDEDEDTDDGEDDDESSVPFWSRIDRDSEYGEDSDEEAEDEETSDKFKVTCAQIAGKLAQMNFTMADLVAHYVSVDFVRNPTKEDAEKYGGESKILRNLEQAIADILDGEIAVNYTNPKQTYAEILKTNLTRQKKTQPNLPSEEIIGTSSVIFTC